MTTEQQKHQLLSAKDILNYFDQNCLTYRQLADPKACQSIFDFRGTLSNTLTAKLMVLRKIVAAIRANHAIQLDNEESLNAALWLCEQPEVEKLTVDKLVSDSYFEQLVKKATKTKIEFSRLIVSHKLLAEYLKSRPEPMFVKFDFDHSTAPVYKYLSEVPLTGTGTRTVDVRFHQEKKTVFYINGEFEDIGPKLNGFLDARSDECHLTFLHGGFLPSVNVAHNNVSEIDLASQHMTKQHLYVWLNMPHKKLRSVSAAACTFDSNETRSVFLEALLKRQNLTRLRLINCGFVETHFQLIKTYAEQHPELVEIDLGQNPLSAETCLAIQKQVERNAVVSDFQRRLKNIEISSEEELDALLLVAHKNGFNQEVISTLEHKKIELYFSRLPAVRDIAMALAIVAKLEQNTYVPAERKYDLFLWLAIFYFKTDPKTEAAEFDILKYLSFIPASDVSRYSQSEAHMKDIFFRMIERILLSDNEPSTAFQAQFIRDLQAAVHNPKDTIQTMIILIENFNRDASMVPLFKEHVRNKSDKANALIKLCQKITPYARTPVASAPPAESVPPPVAHYSPSMFGYEPVAYPPVFQPLLPPSVVPSAEEREYVASLFNKTGGK